MNVFLGLGLPYSISALYWMTVNPDSAAGNLTPEARNPKPTLNPKPESNPEPETRNRPYTRNPKPKT